MNIMPKKLLFRPGGQLVFEDPGKLVFNNFITGTTTTTPTPSSCSNGWPEMIVSVFDADYAGGDITWCGETWNQAAVQAGEQRTICPTAYTKGTVPVVSPTRTCKTGNTNYWFRANLKMYAKFRPPRIIGGGTGTGEYRHFLSVNGPGIGFYGARNALFNTGNAPLPTGCLANPSLLFAGTSVLTLFSGDAFGLGQFFTVNTNIRNTQAGQGGFGVDSAYVDGTIHEILNYGQIIDNGIQYTWQPGNGW